MLESSDIAGTLIVFYTDFGLDCCQEWAGSRAAEAKHPFMKAAMGIHFPRRKISDMRAEEVW